MAPFDPFTQNVTFLGPDGKTKLHVPMPAIDALNDESVSISINYGCQLGACVIMLLTVLVMTPWSKLGRPSNILHILGLVVCIIRMGILCAYFTSPFNDFYAYWAVDYSRVAARYYQASIVGTVFSLLLVIIVELALMNQAWTMVVLWPKRYKWPLAILSLLITLLTVGWRIAFTVIQCESVVSVKPPSNYYWGIYWMMVTNIMSICWFCAIFNVKLIIHLVTNRGILPSSGTLTPMEVLVMTNGLLMVVPVIFTGLEFGKFINFEAASLSLTSVAIILPLGTLVARRMALSSNMVCGSSGSRGHHYGCAAPDTANSHTPLKSPSFTTSSHAGTTPQASVLSRCEAGSGSHYDATDMTDVELDQLSRGRRDAKGASVSRVRVERELEQREERA